jgi:hypothetical protein
VQLDASLDQQILRIVQTWRRLQSAFLAQEDDSLDQPARAQPLVDPFLHRRVYRVPPVVVLTHAAVVVGRVRRQAAPSDGHRLGYRICHRLARPGQQ